ncbi:reverse transcriptase domain-containing protein [Tanacetum coccineum]
MDSPDKAKEKSSNSRQKQSYPGRSDQACRSRDHERSALSQLAFKPAKEAFREIKQRIAELPMLTAPKPKEELIMYMSATREAINAFLLIERDSRQIPIYFVSHALQSQEINYILMEKLILALVHATRRLRRYFQAYLVVIIMDQPIKQILSRPENAGRMAKKRSPSHRHTCGGSIEGSRARLTLRRPDGTEFTYALRFEFSASNSEAEYEALIAGLRIAEQMNIKNLSARVDSRLVANQVNRSYIAKE